MSRVDDLLATGIHQVSRKYRLVARLPAGKTGLEALKERDPRAYQRIMERAEEQAGTEYRRLYAKETDDLIELSTEEFAEYLEKTDRCPSHT